MAEDEKTQEMGGIGDAAGDGSGEASADRGRYLVVEGPIGVGKSSLTRLLADEFNARCVLEEVEQNPFLTGFYQDRQRYAFQTQLFFLLSRYRQQLELAQPDLFQQTTVDDYGFHKDRIFAHLNLDGDELTLYEQVYQQLEVKLPKPDLVIAMHARSDVLLERIARRGAAYEKNFDRDYLEAVVKAYRDYFFYYNDTPLLVVNTSEIDFVQSRGDFDNLVKEIKAMRGGTKHFNPLGSA